MAGVSDPYLLLGLPRSASLRQIKAAHRELAKRYHPDSPTADPARFLRVQEAYQLLVDPLRRREWDARHAPAPVRADEPAPSGWSRQRRAAAGTRAQQAHGYTWSASEVPWWEEGGRRSPRRGPAEGETTGGKTPGGEKAASGDTAGAGMGAAPAPATDGRHQAGPPGAGQRSAADFDVYNRSSGAAWSAAARAYFRRADQDLPRRGSFHYQGSQPLTAARARAAAEDDARRGPVNQPPAAGPRPAAATATANRAWTAPSMEAGIARDVDRIAALRARARRAAAARWPSRYQRLLYALVGWLPLALLIGYGGPVVGGCEPAAATGCPDQVALAQAAGAAILLAALYALPRLAYAAALATTLLGVGGGLLLLAAWLVRMPPPHLTTLSAPALVVGIMVLAIAYALVTAWLAADPARRPWAATAGTRR